MENGINKKSLELFVENIRKEREKEEKIDKFILNGEMYINWLIKKLKEYNYIHTSNVDNSNYIKLLPYLYQIIDRYAKNNDFCPIIIKNYHIYYLNYNGYIFSVFQENIDGNMQYGCFSNYLTKEQIPYYINFDDIRNNREITINDISNGLAKKLLDDIKELFNEGLSLYFINNIISSICENLEDEKKLLKK